MDTDTGQQRWLRQRLTRRSMLTAVGATAGGVWLTAAGDAPPDHRVREVASAVRRPPPPPAVPVPAPQPSSAPQPLPPIPPVRTLADYRRAVPGPPFPDNAVALTIDDGPHPLWTPKVLDLLDRYHVQATFCLIGNQVMGHEDVARTVVAHGHRIANHSQNHLTALPHLPADRIRLEIDQAQEKIYATTGIAPHLFRPPGGGTSHELEEQVGLAGMVPFDWSEDPRDWTRPGTPAITERMLSARPGQILLCHDGGGDRSQTYEALQSVIPALLTRGYQFVSL